MEDINKRVRELDPKKKAALAKMIKDKLDGINLQQKTEADYDLIILGGGQAGSTLARQIIRQRVDTKILIIEKNKFPCPEVAFKVGESNSELGSHYLSEILGLKQHLKQDQLEKGGVRYFFSFDGNQDISRRLEVGLKKYPPVPGFQIDRGRFENHLYKENCEQGITYWQDCQVKDVSVGNPQKVSLTRGTDLVEVTSRWVVDATGRSAFLKRKLDLAETTQHHINSAWFRISGVVDVNEWSENTTWQQRTIDGLRKAGTSHLMGEGYWVWIIVLPSNATSIGIVADPDFHPLEEYNSVDRLINWLHKYEPQCGKVIDERKDQIQDFIAMKHFSHGCKRLYSKDRWCITGEAGVFADPFYSPGCDFIAISNSLISDLIIRDLNGADVGILAEQYNHNILSLFRLYLMTYQDQYTVMGSEQVMLAKIIWDWAIYWGVNAFLFFNNNKAFDLEWLVSIRNEMQRFNELNNTMQNLFKQWNKIDNSVVSDKIFSLLDLQFLYDLHTGLVADQDEESAKTQLAKNIQTLEIVAHEFSKYVSELNKPDVAPMADFQVQMEHLDLDPSIVVSEQMQSDLSSIWISKSQECTV